MPQYSIAKVIADRGFASEIAELREITAKNYQAAIKQGIETLGLKPGDKLSYTRLPCLHFGRSEYTVPEGK